MRKHFVLALVLALVAGLSGGAFGQMRPRRAETGTSQPQPSSPPAPRVRPTPLPQSAPSTQGRPQAGDSNASGAVGEEIGEDEVLRVNASLVTVPVTVLDRDGRFISGLRKEDFRIIEDGAEQQITYFAPVEQPFTVALVLDVSGSTRFKMDEIQSAAIAFLDQLRPEDRVMVVSFDDSVHVLSEATSDRRELRRAIRRTETGGGTRLYDAVDTVIKRLDRIKGRKAIVLFTDGVDTTSRNASYSSTLAQAEELDSLVYPIQYDTYSDMRAGGGGPVPMGRQPNIGDILGSIILGGGRPTIRRGGGGGPGTSPEDYRRGGEYLRRLSEMTGGRHHNADDLYNLEQAFTSIAEELRRQYSLGYYPSRQSQTSERRQIRVRVKRPNLVVRARDSYVYKPSAGNNSATPVAERAPQSPPELRRRNFNPGTR
jgi:VWFA-related protein